MSALPWRKEWKRKREGLLKLKLKPKTPLPSLFTENPPIALRRTPFQSRADFSRTLAQQSTSSSLATSVRASVRLLPRV